MSLRALIQKLAEAVGQDDELIVLANKVSDLSLAIKAVVDDDSGAQYIFYDWDEATRIIKAAEYHSKHAKKLLPHLKKLGDDATGMKKYLDDIIKKCKSVSAREAEESDVDLDREDDEGHKWQEDPEVAVRDKQREFDDAADDLVQSFHATAEGFKEFKRDQGRKHSFDDLRGVTTKNVEEDGGFDLLSSNAEDAAGLCDAWNDEVKWFRQHAEAALAVAKELAGDLPEV